MGAPPRDVRGLVIPGEPAQSLLQQRKQLSVNTTFNYQLQLAVSTTTCTRRQTINIKKDADRSRLMIISKFCQLSTLKSGFYQHICNISNLQTHFSFSDSIFWINVVEGLC